MFINYINKTMLPFKSKFFLFPYWLTLAVRHALYNKGIKKSSSYPIPVICVGNITVGGTGKTPHTEMLVRLLKDKYKVGVLSRGYKRKSKGFKVVKSNSQYQFVGDEPLQIKLKFPDVLVAVCANRREGIEKMLTFPNSNSSTENGELDEYKPEIIILDDGFQHRKVRPSHSIVLMNYNNPIYNDNLLPIGNLRDLPEQIKRANSVIISKSPLFGEIEPGVIFEEEALKLVKEEEVVLRKKLNLRDDQGLYFSVISYGEPKPLFPEDAEPRYSYSQSALYFTGIAKDQEFKDYIRSSHKILDGIKFADHKDFTSGDIKSINNMSKKHPTSVIFTTEKDSVRLVGNKNIDQNLRKKLFYIPIEVKIIPSIKSDTFIEGILSL